MNPKEDESELDYFNSLWKGLGRTMPIKEDETRQIRLVIPVSDVNMLIEIWHVAKVNALKDNRNDHARLAMTSITTLQNARVQHGLEPLVIEEEKDGKTLTLVSNELPDEGDA